ncbi:MAG: hypothetical protein MUC84_02180 [Solirubrobacteraceae bacterium]|nr:hypothetical protein [Solirubrobacteraceae bacterium]
MLKLHRTPLALVVVALAALVAAFGSTAIAKGPKTPNPGKGPDGKGAPGLTKINKKGGVLKLNADSKWQATVNLTAAIPNVTGITAVAPGAGVNPFTFPVVKGRVQIKKAGKKGKLSGFVNHSGGLTFAGADAKTLTATDFRAVLAAGKAGKINGTVAGGPVRLFDLAGTKVENGMVKADLKLSKALDDALTATFGTPADALQPGAMVGTIVVGPIPAP